MPDLPKSIESNRLLLRPHRFGDVEDILVYAIDPEWSRYMPVPHPYARKDAEEFLALAKLDESSTRGAWAIELAGHVIGAIDLRPHGAGCTAEAPCVCQRGRSPVHWCFGWPGRSGRTRRT